MRIVDANTLVGTSIEGARGSLTLMPALETSAFASQVVVVPPNTKAPKPGQPVTSPTLIFVLQGSVTLSNGEFYQKLTPGKMVLLDPGEERVYQTERDKCVALEVRLGGTAPPVPETVPTVAMLSIPEPEQPKRSAAAYEEI